MRRIAVVFSLLLCLLGASIRSPTPSVTAAPPPGGLYKIAVLQVGFYGDWDAGDFARLATPPGVSPFTLAFIPTSAISAGGLAPFNVLVLPWNHDYATWFTTVNGNVILEFVRAGGTLLVHNFSGGVAGADPLMAVLGPAYALTWSGVSGDTVAIANAGNPLASSPNVLTGAGLSGWASSFHNMALGTGLGPLWNVATTATGGAVSGCAALGLGAIVFQGQDPEWHSTALAIFPSPPGSGGAPGTAQPMAFDMIENEVTINRSGLCAGSLPLSEPAPRPNVGGAIAAVVVGAATERERTAAAAPAQPITAPRTGTGITPPNTGDGGLVSSSSSSWALFAIGGIFALTLAGFATLKVARR